MIFTDSAPVTTVLDLVGVWIHDPGAGGQETARGFPYGTSQREITIDSLGEANYYAGRTDPVTDYGEHELTEFRASIDVPRGQEWRTQLDALQGFARDKRTLFIRDNRGRAMYAQLEDYREADQDWGTRVSFTASRSHWTVATVA